MLLSTEFKTETASIILFRFNDRKNVSQEIFSACRNLKTQRNRCYITVAGKMNAFLPNQNRKMISVSWLRTME